MRQDERIYTDQYKTAGFRGSYPRTSAMKRVLRVLPAGPSALMVARRAVTKLCRIAHNNQLAANCLQIQSEITVAIDFTLYSA